MSDICRYTGIVAVACPHCKQAEIDCLTAERDEARAESDRLRDHLRRAEGWQAEAQYIRVLLRGQCIGHPDGVDHWQGCAACQAVFDRPKEGR